MQVRYLFKEVTVYDCVISWTKLKKTAKDNELKQGIFLRYHQRSTFFEHCLARIYTS